MTRAEHRTLTWRKSTYSNNVDDCVEVARTLDDTMIRDSKNPDAGALRFSAAAWRTLRATLGVRSG